LQEELQHESTNLAKYTTRNRVYRWHMDAFRRYLLSKIEPANPSSLLDAGCGEGYLACELKRAFPDCRITGLDASEGAIEYARVRFASAAEFHVGDLLALPFPDDAFDVVVCSEVLEHLDEPGRAFAELRRVARHRVVLTVPLEPWFKLFNDVARRLGISEDPGHVQLWTLKGFQRFVSSLHPGAEFDRKHYYQSAVCKLIPPVSISFPQGWTDSERPGS
jgi:ubiquinone/menaquinone biosynthesis C-methylase UbiE